MWHGALWRGGVVARQCGRRLWRGGVVARRRCGATLSGSRDSRSEPAPRAMRQPVSAQPALQSPRAFCRHPRRPRRLGSVHRSRRSRRVPFHSRHPADHVPRPAVDDAAVRRVRVSGGIQRALSISARQRRQRAERRLRSADADGIRLRPSARRRRSGQGRRRDRFDRGHRDAVQRDPARPRLDLDDDQLDGDHSAVAVRGGRQTSGRRAGERSRARCRTTSSRSTSPAAPTSTRRARRCGSSPTSSRSASASCPTGTRFRSAAITSARPDRRRCRKLRSPSRMRSPTCSPPSTPGST